ncbi:MAG: hypothetical protein SCH39_04350 [Methanosarcinales archaeon]|nr:hypothetical protein [Methanosarcinales archaeon]
MISITYYLTPPGDVEAMAGRVVQLLEDEGLSRGWGSRQLKMQRGVLILKGMQQSTLFGMKRS